MEGEMKSFMVVYLTVLTSLCYCHTIGKVIPRGIARLLLLFPVIALFLYLPLSFTTISLGSTTSFLISWLANFKLLLYAFGRGPLSNTSLPRFILVGCLPIKIHHRPSPDQNQENSPKCHKSPLNYTTKLLLLISVSLVYRYRERVPPQIITLVYCFHIYTTLEFMLAVMAALARAIARLELEPQFHEPYLASSLQDFWGRRWNLIVGSILRPAVYDPLRMIASGQIGRKWAALPAVIVTFLVSGLMHEMILFHVGRARPTWQMLGFFIIHGVCLVVEICVKKALNGKFRVPSIVSGPLVLGFVLATGSWLFIGPIVECNVDVKAGRETAAIVEFLKGLVRLERKG
ncbi:Long-chain-alcohol O-fatty-acyltransferase [Bertholletia excelsa]